MINNEVLGESIIFKGMEVQGRFDGKTGQQMVSIEAFQEEPLKAWYCHQNEGESSGLRAGWMHVGRGKVYSNDCILCSLTIECDMKFLYQSQSESFRRLSMIRGEWECWKDVELFVFQRTTLQELIRVSKPGVGRQVSKVAIVILVYLFLHF